MSPRKSYRDSLPQGAKREFSDLLASAEKFNRVSTDFLKVDVQTALTFSKIALETNDSVKKHRNQRSARKAYDTVVKLMKKVEPKEHDAQDLSSSLKRLKSELQSLGEVF